MKLKKTEQYVLDLVPESPIDDTRLLDMVLNYSTLMDKPQVLGQFIPCDKKGNILSLPNKISPDYLTRSDNKMTELIDEYDEAKKRVLFYGFQYLRSYPDYWELIHDTGNIYLLPKVPLKKVSDLCDLHYDIELTKDTRNKI